MLRRSPLATVVMLVALGALSTGEAGANPSTDGDVKPGHTSLTLGASDPGDPGSWAPSGTTSTPESPVFAPESPSEGSTTTSDGISPAPAGSAPGPDPCAGAKGATGFQELGCGVTGFVPAVAPAGPAATGPGAPPAPPPPPPNPVELGQEATDQMVIPVPTVATSPQAPVEALVGLKTWLWIPAERWRPLSESVTAGATTVTATLRPVGSVWDLGEGVERCAGPGQAWRPGLEQEESACGYTYAHTSNGEPGGRFEVSTVVHYAATWTCTGVCTSNGGDLGILDSPAQVSRLRVGERQSVVIGGS